LLGPDGARVQGIFVTVDPARDTAEVLKAYAANFGPDFVGLRGTPEQTKAAAKEFKVFFAKVPGKTDTSYTIDHTAGSTSSMPRARCACSPAIGPAGADLKAAGRADLKILLAEPACDQAVSSALRIFFIAATSIWRMRSALTPYSAARSCSVMPPELSSLTFSQRSSTMRRLRASSTASARTMPSLASQSRRRASSARVGSLLSSAR
jgi:hypothetical protein